MSRARVVLLLAAALPLAAQGPQYGLGRSATEAEVSEVVTDAGAIHALLGWNPNPPVVGKNNLNINFSDALNGNRLNADVTYNLNIRTKDGQEIVKSNNITAINGISNQTLSFPSKGLFNLEVKVNSLKFANQTNLDTTRNGIARGFVVIP